MLLPEARNPAAGMQIGRQKPAGDAGSDGQVAAGGACLRRSFARLPGRAAIRLHAGPDACIVAGRCPARGRRRENRGDEVMAVRSGMRIGRWLAAARRAGAAALRALLRRPPQLQAAALCHRRDGGRLRILLITSRGTGRWILPKGWLMRGKNAGEAAVQEAWEEAGVRARPASVRQVGSYAARKVSAGGLPVPVETLVFAVEVAGLTARFPEAGQRQRRWFDPAEAAERVAEPELKRLIREFGDETRG